MDVAALGSPLSGELAAMPSEHRSEMPVGTRTTITPTGQSRHCKLLGAMVTLEKGARVGAFATLAPVPLRFVVRDVERGYGECHACTKPIRRADATP